MASLLYHEGKPVYDAKKPLTFTINDADVAKGKKFGVRDEKNCVGSVGLCRTQHVSDARVNLTRTLVLNKTGKKWLRYQTGQAMRTQVVSFDQNGGFQVGQYTLMPFSKSKLLGQTQGTKTRPKKPGARVKRTARSARLNVRPPAKRPTKNWATA